MLVKSLILSRWDGDKIKTKLSKQNNIHLKKLINFQLVGDNKINNNLKSNKMFNSSHNLMDLLKIKL